jgi:hypothetical protein
MMNTTIDHQAAYIHQESVSVWMGLDGIWVVQIDTGDSVIPHEPNGQPILRVNVNDGKVFGPEFNENGAFQDED